MYCPEYIRKLSVRGSVSMSAREQVLMKIIANLRRLGIDISNSKFKDKDIENEVVMTVYIKDVREYMACYENRHLIIHSGLQRLLQLQDWNRMLKNLELTAFLNHSKE